MKTGRLNVVLDLQWGSTGKGKLCAYLAQKHAVDVATVDFQPNAGHTIVFDDGRKVILKQFPAAALFGARVLMNPGATLSVARVLEEVEICSAKDRLVIHPHASVVTEAHKKWEQENLKRISSTLQGAGAALGLKSMRAPETVLAKDVPELHRWIGDTTEAIHTYIRAGAMCVAEGAQGFDLSLNHGFRYPYVTSRDVTTASIMSNAGVPPQLLGDVYGCLRTFPIRVGHQLEKDGTKVGDSGPFYEDQMELTWDDLKIRSGAKHDLLERTTVTNKVRRVFTFSSTQLRRAMRVCWPTHLFINFINHVDAGDLSKRTWGELSDVSRDFVHRVSNMADEANAAYPHGPSCIVSHIGTGPSMSDMVEL